MKNSKIAEIYDKIELDEFSKQKMFTQIKEKVYNQGAENKSKIWNYKKLTSLIAVCACAIIVFKIPGVQATIQEYINNFASWISGNSKDDYLEEVNLSVENNNMSLKIVNAQRVDNEVRLRYEITFPKNIEDIINLDEYGYKEYEYENGKYFSIKRVFNSEIFENCEIYINNLSMDYIQGDEFGLNDESFWLVDVKDIEVKDNKLTQELVVILEDEYINKDIDFRFEFKKFNLNNEIITTNLCLEYTLKGGEYSNEEITIKPINHQIKVDNNGLYDFYGYSYTKTGIKLYAKHEIITNDEIYIYLHATDNYGKEYLMYPKLQEENIVVFGIFSNEITIENEYIEYFNKNIKSLDIEFMTASYDEDAEGYTVTNKISEFNVNFEENNK